MHNILLYVNSLVRRGTGPLFPIVFGYKSRDQNRKKRFQKNNKQQEKKNQCAHTHQHLAILHFFVCCNIKGISMRGISRNVCTTTQKPSPSFHCWWTILFYFQFSHTFIFYALFQYHSFGSQGGGRRFDSANGYCFFWALVINLLGFWNLLDKKEHTRFM